MSAIASAVLDLSLPHPRSPGELPIATLGPAGTSSEASAYYLAEYLAAAWADRPSDPRRYPVRLFDRYELAAEAVLDGSCSLLLVANAYDAVSAFYMDSRLSVLGVYCFDTPEYGIAAPSGRLPEGPMTIASHPAPVPIIEQLLEPGRAALATVLRYDSTSAAAAAAVDGGADVALTTAPAAAKHGLTFVTRTRNIRMVWSVFGRSWSDAGMGPVSP